MGIFDFLLGRDGREKKNNLIVRNTQAKVSQLEHELEFKNREIGSLHMQVANLTKQNDVLVATIEKLTNQMVDKKNAVLIESEHFDEKQHEVKKSIDEVSELFEKGVALSRGRKYQAAIQIFDKLLDRDGEHKQALLNKAICLHKLKKTDEALSMIDHLLELDAQYKDAWLNKGIFLDEMGRHQEAVKCFDKVIFINRK
ncbi:tetratricopeptide repeat protein [Candidatus Woesearchaeota archaeon]|nr:tetratricopeptide repeat protein [Candidatus Woesearchaeota archaeon]